MLPIYVEHALCPSSSHLRVAADLIMAEEALFTVASECCFAAARARLSDRNGSKAICRQSRLPVRSE